MLQRRRFARVARGRGGPPPADSSACITGGCSVKSRVSIFIFCQSFGWDLMQTLPFLDGLADVRSCARPILGSSCASLPTLLSGTLPAEHKHFSWFYYSPINTPFRVCRFLSYLPVFRHSRKLRDNIVLAVKKSSHITGRLDIFNMPLRHLPLFDFTERRNLLLPGALGNVPTIIDFLDENNVPYVCSSPDRSDLENADIISAALLGGTASVAFWHVAGIDAILTRRGMASSAIRARVAWLDHRLRGIHDIARARYRRVDLVVFSDSGVIPILDFYNLRQRIQDTRFLPYVDYVAVYEPTMARFWFMSPSCEPVFRRILQSLPCGRIIEKDELAREGCWFDDHRFGQIIFIANPGTVFTPNHIQRESSLAARGYHPDTPGMAAAFMCNLPGIVPPATLPDIHDFLVRNVTEDDSEIGEHQPSADTLIRAKQHPVEVGATNG